MYDFTEDCVIGVAAIDEEHRQLFKMINEAMELLGQQDADSLVSAKSLVVALKKYASTHFAHEEAYMEEIHDKELTRQKAEHRAFTDKVNSYDLSGLDEDSARKVLEELLMYLSRWLYSHILGSDMMIGHNIAEEADADPFAFTDEYKTGIAMVDEEHQQLFDIIRNTNDLINDELLHDKYDKIVDILGELKEYTVKHFSDEEAYMEEIHYSGLDAQKLAHTAFVDKLNEIDLDQVDDNQQEYLNGLIDFLLGWLVNHILKMDKKIS